MKKDSFCVALATQGAIGFSKAPGTVGTAVMLPVVYAIGRCDLASSWYAILTFFVFVCGVYVTYCALPEFGNKDASEIVVDEMAAFLFVFLGITISFWSLAVGFLLFRFFDIVKPLGITYIERIPGVVGVMGDDVAAALTSNALLHFLHWVIF